MLLIKWQSLRDANQVTLKLVEEDHANSERDVVDLAVVASGPASPRVAGNDARRRGNRGRVSGDTADDGIDELVEVVQLDLDADAVRRQGNDREVHLGMLEKEEVESGVDVLVIPRPLGKRDGATSGSRVLEIANGSALLVADRRTVLLQDAEERAAQLVDLVIDMRVSDIANIVSTQMLTWIEPISS